MIIFYSTWNIKYHMERIRCLPFSLLLERKALFISYVNLHKKEEGSERMLVADLFEPSFLYVTICL